MSFDLLTTPDQTQSTDIIRMPDCIASSKSIGHVKGFHAMKVPV